MNAKINFSLLTGSMLATLVRSIIAIINIATMSEGVLKVLAQKLVAILEKFVKGFEYDSKDPLTAEIEKYDALRDKYFNGLKNSLKSFLCSENEEKATAAEKLLDIVRKHGWNAAKLSFDKESNSLNGLILELEADYVAQCTLLNCAEWITPMKAAELKFEEVRLAQVANGINELPTITRYRKPLIAAVKKFISTLESHAEATEDAALINMMNQIDELIGRTMATAKASATRRENQQDEPITEETATEA